MGPLYPQARHQMQAGSPPAAENVRNDLFNNVLQRSHLLAGQPECAECKFLLFAG
jgi:hypothetical protein